MFPSRRRKALVALLAALLIVTLFLLPLSQPPEPASTFYLRYHSVPALLARLTRLPSRCPTAVLRRIGTSHAGFPLHLLTLGRTPAADPARILLTAGMHGRERSTSLAALRAAEGLCDRLRNGDAPPALASVQALFVPVMNPDGQEISRTRTEAHRKNGGGGGTCVTNAGVDLNRNFPAAWGLGNGSSHKPCHDQYAGAYALSEPESAALAGEVVSLPGLRAHADVHAFGQVLYRGRAYEGYAEAMPRRLMRKQRALARAMRMRMRGVAGADYVDVDAAVGTRLLTNRTQGGTLMDFMMERGVACVTVELGPRTTRQNRASGFHTPEAELEQREREVGGVVDVLLEMGMGRVEEVRDEDLGLVFD